MNEGTCKPVHIHITLVGFQKQKIYLRVLSMMSLEGLKESIFPLKDLIIY